MEKIQAWTVADQFPVSKVNESYHENGTPIDIETTENRAPTFINELLWCM